MCISTDGRLFGRQEGRGGVSGKFLPDSGQGRPQLCSLSASGGAKPTGIAASKKRLASRPLSSTAQGCWGLKQRDGGGRAACGTGGEG